MRQEQIKQAAITYLESADYLGHTDLESMIHMAEWADQRPNIDWPKMEAMKLYKEMCKYKSACDVMMKALEYEIEQCEPSPKLDDITAAIAEAKKILEEK